MKEDERLEGTARFTSRAVKSAAIGAPVSSSTILAAENLLMLPRGTLNELITERRAKGPQRKTAQGHQEPRSEVRLPLRRSTLPKKSRVNILKEARRYRYGD